MFWFVLIILVIAWVPIMAYILRQSWEPRGNIPPILRDPSVRTIGNLITMGLPIIVGVMFWNHSGLVAGIVAWAIMFGVAQIVNIVSYRYVFTREKAEYLEMVRSGRIKAISDAELNEQIKWSLKENRKGRG